jgi:hypothetical protein
MGQAGKFYARVGGLFAGSRAQIVYYDHVPGDPPGTLTLLSLPGYYDDVNSAHLLANELNEKGLSPREAIKVLRDRQNKEA